MRVPEPAWRFTKRTPGRARSASAQFKLDFTPLVKEVYYFAVRRDALEEPAMRQLRELMRTPAYHKLVDAVPGYDARGTGELVEIADAFAAPA